MGLWGTTDVVDRQTRISLRIGYNNNPREYMHLIINSRFGSGCWQPPPKVSAGVLRPIRPGAAPSGPRRIRNPY